MINRSRNTILLERTGLVFALFVAVFTLIPYYWMLLGAFKTVPELNRIPPTFIVEKPTLNSFYDAKGELPPDHTRGLFQIYPGTKFGFFRYLFNSVFISGSITFASLMIAALAAFVLAKHKFPGRDFFFLMFIASMMIPWQVTIIPNFLNVSDFGWIDSYWALLIPALPKAFALFFLRQYMLSLPDEMLEAGRLDGASEFRIFRSLVLPLVGPALVSMGLFIWLNEWNNLVWPLIVIRSEELRTLPLIMTTMVDPFSGASKQGVAMAAALLTSIPTLILFIAFQKQFIQGIAVTSVKG
ncbi:MAG: carbohydrate ABC transporter permease [Anaerolineae bacterium]|nr:MAG: carbohydrate ABC transporter permease [Anaerolineae bacterium]